MKNIIPILFLSLVFAQDSGYDKIIEDHDKAVQEIFDEQIVDQNKNLERILAKEDYRTLTTQALSSGLGFFVSYATEGPIPWIIGSTIVPLIKIRKINKSNDSIELKNERKKRVKRNAQLGSIPFFKWYIVLFRTPKAIIDNIS
ncbi:MAG: hypothetical protein HOL62_01590 [Candidatus Marinimicrobia bacterium]|jgi:hypothetical protein|nr:hypothetical protein [Gammaproteobacteria bacterium]MBL6911367.1 hypothetical protein [Candidatus Neomarinimicrobiota bacterium]MBT3728295.1 hypothetical protein [Candidatus Neomarinimicrobiota bacterium]MBT3944622.1 hypothetical protein [Candidatus Neomarinimicrobiota bacterium]MBT4317104.1 hypothetical protein [Candidatus Neomarinimicrobiota bacterium]